MGKIYLTSDLHFGHNRDFLYAPRGFKNIYEHDNYIIDTWNNIIKSDDDVYILGDLMLNDNDYGITCIKELTGKLHIIRGNHDSDVRMNLYKDCWNVSEICEGKYFRYDKYHFYLSHYPCLCSNFDEDKPLKTKCISLCGHSHCQDPFQDWDKGLIFHTELDTHHCCPWDIDDIINLIKERYNNEL